MAKGSTRCYPALSFLVRTRNEWTGTNQLYFFWYEPEWTERGKAFSFYMGNAVLCGAFVIGMLNILLVCRMSSNLVVTNSTAKYNNAYKLFANDISLSDFSSINSIYSSNSIYSIKSPALLAWSKCQTQILYGALYLLGSFTFFQFFFHILSVSLWSLS